MDPKRKFFLFKQSKNFCSAPWTNIFLNADGGIYTCCVGKTELGNIRKNSLPQIINNNIAFDIKSKLSQDQPHQNCETCQNLNSDSDPWMRGYYNDLGKQIDIDYEDPSQFKLAFVDPRWSNSCNLRCVYCSPQWSSSIEKELKISFSNGDAGNDQVLNLILENQNNIKEIYLAGGEPLLMKENREFLKKYKNFDTHLRINTNLTNINTKNEILELIKNFKNITWTISVENTNDRYEYTRYGSDWNQFLKNIDSIKSLNHIIRFNMVYFVGNAITFYDDFIFLKELVAGCGFSLVPVLGHDAISTRNLSSELKIQAQNDLNKLIKSLANDKSLCNNINNCIKELEKEPNGLDYKDYFDSLDAKRGTNWKTVFPELV